MSLKTADKLLVSPGETTHSAPNGHYYHAWCVRTYVRHATKLKQNRWGLVGY